MNILSFQYRKVLNRIFKVKSTCLVQEILYIYIYISMVADTTKLQSTHFRNVI